MATNSKSLTVAFHWFNLTAFRLIFERHTVLIDAILKMIRK